MGRIDRFAEEGEVIDAMRTQRIIRGDLAVATALTRAGKVVGFAPGEEMIRQGGTDNDCYFLLAGSVGLRVNGELLPYGRTAGEVVGEFSAINPALPRTATVTAADEVVALRCAAKDLKEAGARESEVWRLLAIELTRKVEQRNRLISTANDRPSIFMIATKNRLEVAKALKLALLRDFAVELWSDEELVRPGDYPLETLHGIARSADFAIVLAHPGDLDDARDRMGEEEWSTVRFELGYLMAELGRHRTLLMIPDGGEGATYPLFKGMQPMTYDLPSGGMPMDVALTRAVEAIRELVASRKVRSRLQKAP